MPHSASNDMGEPTRNNVTTRVTLTGESISQSRVNLAVARMVLVSLFQ